MERVAADLPSPAWPLRVLRRARQRAGRWLWVYWPAILVVTHLPPLDWWEEHRELPSPNAIGADKLFHFAGYAGLGLLLTFLLARRLRPLSAAMLTIPIVLAYGVFDELTQPWFGRTADPWDLLADALGLATGLAVALAIERRTSNAQRPTSK